MSRIFDYNEAMQELENDQEWQEWQDKQTEMAKSENYGQEE